MTKVKIIKGSNKGDQIKLENLYLNRHNLKETAEKLGKAFVYSNYITDKEDVVAVKDSPGTPKELKNKYDWRLFQELLAQADVLITASRYFRKVEKEGAETIQNLISQFDEGAEFEKLGKWRLVNGYEKRNPDIAVVSKSLDFNIPNTATKRERSVYVFTTHPMFGSRKANNLRAQGAKIIAAGVEGVDGQTLIDHLHHECGYNTVKLVAGPQLLKILLDSDVLNRLYITQVQKKINAPDKKKIAVVKNKKVSDINGFKLTEEYLQENVVLDDGTTTDQRFLVYDNKNSDYR